MYICGKNYELMQNVTRNAQKNKIADFGRQKHKNTSQPIFVKKVFVPLCIMYILYTSHFTFYNPLKYLSSFPSNGPKSKQILFLTDFLVRLQKKFGARVRSILMPHTFHIASLNRYTPN